MCGGGGEGRLDHRRRETSGGCVLAGRHSNAASHKHSPVIYHAAGEAARRAVAAKCTGGVKMTLISCGPSCS